MNDIIAIPEDALYENETISFIKIFSLNSSEEDVFKCINLLIYKPSIFNDVLKNIKELDHSFDQFSNKLHSWKVEEPAFVNENLKGNVDLTGMYVVFNAEYYPQILFDPVKEKILIYDFFIPEIQGFLRVKRLIEILNYVEKTINRVSLLTTNSNMVLIAEEYQKVAREIRRYDYFRIDRRVNVQNSNLVHLVSVSTAASINTPDSDFNFCWKISDRSQTESFSGKIIGIGQNGRIVESTSYGHHCSLIMEFKTLPTLVKTLPVDRYTIPLIGMCREKDWIELKYLFKLSEYLGARLNSPNTAPQPLS